MTANSTTPDATPTPIPAAAPAEIPWVITTYPDGLEAGNDVSVDTAEIEEADVVVWVVESSVVVELIGVVPIVMLKNGEG